MDPDSDTRCVPSELQARLDLVHQAIEDLWDVFVDDEHLATLPEAGALRQALWAFDLVEALACANAFRRPRARS